jgi:hypothetical protein
MKLNTTPRRNVDAAQAQWERQLANAVNAIAEGRQAAFYTAAASVPTTGTYAEGDFVLNSAPAELGSASSKYIIHGWRYVSGAFLQCRFLTGN